MDAGIVVILGVLAFYGVLFIVAIALVVWAISTRVKEKKEEKDKLDKYNDY